MLARPDTPQLIAGVIHGHLDLDRGLLPLVRIQTTTPPLLIGRVLYFRVNIHDVCPLRLPNGLDGQQRQPILIRHRPNTFVLMVKTQKGSEAPSEGTF